MTSIAVDSIALTNIAQQLEAGVAGEVLAPEVRSMLANKKFPGEADVLRRAIAELRRLPCRSSNPAACNHCQVIRDYESLATAHKQDHVK